MKARPDTSFCCTSLYQSLPVDSSSAVTMYSWIPFALGKPITTDSHTKCTGCVGGGGKIPCAVILNEVLHLDMNKTIHEHDPFTKYEREQHSMLDIPVTCCGNNPSQDPSTFFHISKRSRQETEMVQHVWDG